ncbi:MAG: 1-deoxy-D-xylulose-5-phosphate reductoisomerase [Acidobacteriota bacterium]
MRTISVIGSTGSIGTNTLDVVEHLGDLRIAALAAGRNVDLLARQVERFRPELVSCSDENCAAKLEGLLGSRGIPLPRIAYGEAGLEAAATLDEVEIVVSAAVGAVGLLPTLRAVEAGKRVALANKEALVIAGELITKAAERSGAEILPVDSEHNAIHQCLRGERRGEVKRLILTASGGPFRKCSQDRLDRATVDEALDHPNWKMGEKISIDSATLMNKGFEVIEARWLFGFEADRISVIVHPQSIIHSMVEMVDGSIMAQMGVTDMKHAIQYALTYPERKANCLEPLDIARLTQLTFEQPDMERFPCLGLAFSALKAGGTMPAVLNAANEISVQAFLDREIGFTDIAEINQEVMGGHEPVPADTLERIRAADLSAREAAAKVVSSRSVERMPAVV